MAKDQGVKLQAARGAKRPARAAAATPAKLSGSAAPAASQPAPKKRTSPAQFWQEVRTETRKISWPSWKETWITSVMVLIMVAVTSIFFLVVDGGLGFAMQQVLRIAGG